MKAVLQNHFSAFPLRMALNAMLALLLLIAVHEQIPAILLFVAGHLLSIAPMIFIGIILSASVSATGSMSLIAAAFSGQPIRMLLAASFIGALTPVCGVSVLPLVAGLLAARVPFAPIMAFWLSSPITDPGMLAITAGTLGGDFALGKTLAAFLIGTLGGLITLLLSHGGHLNNPVRDQSTLSKFNNACSTESNGILWMFWQEEVRRKTYKRQALSNAKRMLVWLSAAFVAEYFVMTYLPGDLVTGLVGEENQSAVFFAALVGMPIYLDGYAALPFVRGLMDSGMSNGAAMAFLISGGMTSAWAAIPVFALVRLPAFVL